MTDIYRVVILLMLIALCKCESKYSAQANQKSVEPSISTLRTLDKPFRMAKLNLLWTKAQLRLTDTKLKSLFGELKIHDKEEILWKQSKDADKDGLKEAELRKKLIGIMSTYDLLEHFQDVQDPKKHKEHKAFNDVSDEYLNKSFFKDKKLNKLWTKAENSGFTTDELRALKEEFYHHQDKIDQYYALLEDVESRNDDHENSIDEGLDKFNALNAIDENELPTGNKDYLHKANLLRDKHQDLRNGYDRLHHLAAKGPRSKEFIEPKVQNLWTIAVQSNFSTDELSSLRVELKHYEQRLLKLRNLQVEAAIGVEKLENKQLPGEKHGEVQRMEELIRKQTRKANMLHEQLESRIMQKHVEL